MNFEKEYLGIIISTYEEGLFKQQKTKAYKLLLNRSLGDLKAFNKISKSTVDGFPGSSYDFESNPEDVNKKQDKKVKQNELDNLGIGLRPDQLSNYIERCIGCDLRLQFDWQLLPPDGLLNGLLDTLKGMKDVLSNLTNVLSTKKNLEQICSISELFKGIPCPQDILAIVMSLKLLLNKYGQIGLRLKLDWFALFGPLVSAIISLLQQFVNMIFSSIIGPIDCSLSVMKTGLDYLRLIDSLSYATPKFKKPEITSQTISTKTTTSESSTINTGDLSLTASQDLVLNTKNLNNSKIPTGFTIGNDLVALLSKPSTENGYLDLSLPEKIIMAVSEGKSHLEHFKNEMLELFNSLNGLMKGTKFLEIQNISALIVLSELISLILTIADTDFTTLCSNQTNPELERVIKSYIQNSDGSLSVKINRTSNDITATLTKIDSVEEFNIKPCSTANTSQDLSKLQSIIEDIQRIGSVN